MPVIPEETGKIFSLLAEEYRMMRITGSALLVLILLLPAWTAAAGVNLTASAAREEGGLIAADLMIRSPEGGVPDGYLTWWLARPGDACDASRFLGWQAVSPSSGGRYGLKAPVPTGIMPGEYLLIVLFGSGNSIPGACDRDTAAEAGFRISTAGSVPDMASALTRPTGNETGPDYRIVSVKNLDTTARRSPGSTISPGVTLSNRRGDDTSGLPVEIHAYLGSNELFPVQARTPPVKGGEDRSLTLSFRIPETLPLKSYPFFLIIDPRGDHGAADVDSLKRTGGQMSIRTEEADPLAGHGCNCR